jgi:hypothetical protein
MLGRHCRSIYTLQGVVSILISRWPVGLCSLNIFHLSFVIGRARGPRATIMRNDLCLHTRPRDRRTGFFSVRTPTLAWKLTGVYPEKRSTNIFVLTAPMSDKNVLTGVVFKPVAVMHKKTKTRLLLQLPLVYTRHFSVVCFEGDACFQWHEDC